MDWIEKKIDGIVNDRRHGAAQLASSAIRILMAVCQRSESTDLKELALTIKQTALSLTQARPSMAPIRNWSLVFAQRFLAQTNAGFSIRDAKRQGVLVGRNYWRCSKSSSTSKLRLQTIPETTDRGDLELFLHSGSNPALRTASRLPGCHRSIPSFNGGTSFI